MVSIATADCSVNGNMPVEKEDIILLDDVLRLRAIDKTQVPLLCFPKSERDIVDYESFNGRDIDRFVDQAVKHYMRCGLQPIKSGDEKPPVIALLGPTDLGYIITFFALARLGFTSLCLSPRLAPNAYEKLIRETGAVAIIFKMSLQTASVITQLQDSVQIKTIVQTSRADFDKPTWTDPKFQRPNINRDAEKEWTLAVLHSSGTTGLPKPIYLSHRRIMVKLPAPKGQKALSTFPFFHGYGQGIVIHGIVQRLTVYMYNPNLPVTAESVIKILNHIRPEVLHVVPYTMELLAQSEAGIDAMKKCERLVFSGSAAPDDLGNSLVAKGVNVESMWGATEIGVLGTSINRAPGDSSWDFIRIPPHIAKYIWMKPLEDDTYECVYLHGLPTLVVSNSNDPPKSFHSNDVFVKHPRLDAWKYIGRLDDRITLINGEKVLPVPMEGRIRQHPLIRQCCVFGTGKSIPGILVFRNDASRDMSDQEFVEAIWPTIQSANAQAESFSQISKETVVPLGADIDYPKTDKESIKRSQIYRVFARDIESVYEKLDYIGSGTLQLDIPSMEDWIVKTFKDTLGVDVSNSQRDFFAAGVNSLQAIQVRLQRTESFPSSLNSTHQDYANASPGNQKCFFILADLSSVSVSSLSRVTLTPKLAQMRGLILKELDLGVNGREVGRNVVFDTANTTHLARYLHALRVDDIKLNEPRDEIEEMEALIKRYSTFEKHVPGQSPAPEGHVVVLTGSTGSLGAHILTLLLTRSDVRKVYCLVRGENPQGRVLEALRKRGLSVPDTTRLVALTGDLSRSDLGLSPAIFTKLQSETTCIVHSAWAINFNLGLQSFEEQYIKGVHNLVQFSLSVSTPAPARLFFCSSISTALGSPRPATIPETPIFDLTAALPQGYARSKLVSEHIVRNAARDAGALTRTLRIGQIVGDGKMGLWNDTEAVPLIIRSALTLKVLPALDETESWLPVDDAAAAILDLAGISTGTVPVSDSETNLVYNLENPHTFSWTDSLLPELHRSGLDFSTVPVADWLQKLRNYEKSGGDTERNPAVKLIDHFERAYGTERAGNLEFETKLAQKHSPALRATPRLIEEGYIRKFVKAWLAKWEGEGKGLQVESSG